VVFSNEEILKPIEMPWMRELKRKSANVNKSRKELSSGVSERKIFARLQVLLLFW
jgi:hypothetical protein